MLASLRKPDRKELFHKVKTEPADQVSKYFEQLILSYDQTRPGTWKRMKDEGIVDLTLDLLDPPDPERPFDRHTWYLSLSTIKMSIGCLVEMEKDPTAAAQIRDRMPAIARRAWKIMTTGMEQGESQNNRFSMMEILQNICLIHENDFTFYQKLRDSHVQEMAMAGWATPVMNVTPDDELSYLSQCYDVFKHTSTVPSSEETAEGILVNEANPTLSPESIRVCERAGVTVILQRMHIILNIRGMLDLHLFFSLEMIKSFFMVEKLRVEFIKSPLLKWVIEKMYQQLKDGKMRDVDLPCYQIAIRAFYAVLEPDMDGEEEITTPEWNEAVTQLSDHVDLIPFLSKTILVIAEADDSHSLACWEKVARLIYASRNIRAIIPRIIEESWLHTMGCLRDLPLDLKWRSAAIEVWRRFLYRFHLDEKTLAERSASERRRKNKGRIGCAWYKCPLYNTDSHRKLFECVHCQRTVYCSEYCQEGDWVNHSPKCRPKK